MNEIVCEGCGQYESECQCYGEKVTMNKEVRDFIDDEVYSSLLSLVEHDRCPTKLELDRFIKSLGYHLIKPENLTVQNEKYDRLTYLDEATEITKDGRPKVERR